MFFEILVRRGERVAQDLFAHETELFVAHNALDDVELALLPDVAAAAARTHEDVKRVHQLIFCSCKHLSKLALVLHRVQLVLRQIALNLDMPEQDASFIVCEVVVRIGKPIQNFIAIPAELGLAQVT